MQNQLYIAIPLLDELDNLEALLQNISQQNFKKFSVYFCINQPEAWWDDPEKLEVCRRNIESVAFIQEKDPHADFPIYTIDRSSKGQGWQGKKLGVGWARKTLMDEISKVAQEGDIILSLDGDTSFDSDYFQNIWDYFKTEAKIDCLSIPYYHPLGQDEQANRAILRYEIYMRYYALNLMCINSPYSFTALGSAIAFRTEALKKIGGFTPKKSGEDFYFLQKMCKYKGVGIWIDQKVYPSARFSDRVFFGTGPAMIKGNQGDWDSYPLYPMELFDQIKDFYNLIPKLYEKDITTPLDSFFGDTETRNSQWDKLRKNNKDLAHFTKAIHDYFDGLKILQFLKQSYQAKQEEENLIHFLRTTELKDLNYDLLENFSFASSSIAQLNAIRDYLCKLEDIERQRINYTTWKTNL